MWCTSYYQENLLQSDATHHILGESNTVKNYIIEELEDHNKEIFQSSRFKAANNASSAQNYVLLTLTQYLTALANEVQGIENRKKNRQSNNNKYKITTSWYKVPFW